MPWLLSIPKKDPVPIVQEGGWAPGPVWMCAENLAPTGVRSPDRPAHSQSLYRLSYPAHNIYTVQLIFYGTVTPTELNVSVSYTTLSSQSL
jgi:hypothetical protein